MEHSQAIVRKSAHGIRRVARKDGAWDSQDSVSVSLAPPDENVLIVQMGSSVSFVRIPANLQRRVTERATALGMAHVAAWPRLRETIWEFPAAFVQMASTEQIVRTSATGKPPATLKAAATATRSVCV